MIKVTIIKTNGFFDILESDIEISDDYITMDTIDECMSAYDDGIFVLYPIKISYDSGQMGEYSWEIPPYWYLDDYRVTKKADLKSHITKAERKFNRVALDERRAKKLQEYVSSFSNDKVRFALCKVWGGHDSLAFREVRGTNFTMYKTITTFEDDSPSVKNVREIRKFVDSYFANAHLKPNIDEKPTK